MRVLHVCGCYEPAVEWGGVVSAVASMVRALSSAGVDVEVFTTTQRSGRAAPSIEPGSRCVDGTRVTYFRSIHPLGRAFFAPTLAPSLRRRAREFDVVHLHMLWTAAGMLSARACQALGVPYVVSLHGALSPWALSQRSLEKKAFLAMTERRNLERAALLHFTTDAERDLSPGWARRLSSIVLPDIVDAEPFAGLGDRALRAASFELLVLSRIHPVKGFDVLVPAMKRVVSEEPRARLVIAGPDEGGYRFEVERAVADAGLTSNVTFTGLLDADGRGRALARAAALVAPSHQENFGMSVAEAMASGLPVIVSDKVNIARDVALASAGHVVPLDPEALATALLAVLRDREESVRMGAAGRQLVLERYGRSSVAARLSEAYREVSGGAQGTSRRQAS